MIANLRPRSFRVGIWGLIGLLWSSPSIHASGKKLLLSHRFEKCPTEIKKIHVLSKGKQQKLSRGDLFGSYSLDELQLPFVVPDVPNVLRSDFVSIPYAALKSVASELRYAEYLYRRLLFLHAPRARTHPTNRFGKQKTAEIVHLSKTHSYHDLMTILVALLWPYQQSIHQPAATALMLLSYLDDYVDRPEAADFRHKLRQKLNSPSAEIPDFLGELDRELKWKTKLLLRKFFLPQVLGSYALDTFEFGIQRMLFGSILFSKKGQFKTYWKLHTRMIQDQFPEHSPFLEELLNHFHPMSLALTVKPVYEVVDALAKPLPLLELSILKNLLYGPMIYAHNIRLEAKEEDSPLNQEVLRQLRADLEKTKNMIAQRRDYEIQDILLSFGSLLEAFEDVLRRENLFDTYAEMLGDPRFRDHFNMPYSEYLKLHLKFFSPVLLPETMSNQSQSPSGQRLSP